MSELNDRVRIVLDRCRGSKITISKKKLQIGNKIHFAGHIISNNGIKPDEAKYEAIKKFPRPEDLKDLRSFIGLATQLGMFVPDLAHMLSYLRPLLKRNIAWNWTEDIEKHFEEIKTKLCSETVIHPFDLSLIHI